jgi:signal transduction histidine kinase
VVPTVNQKKLRLAIIGGGRGGLDFLRLFHQARDIEILGIADTRPEAPAIKYAQTIDIPTTTDFRQLIKGDKVDLIVDVTGNPDVRVQIINEKDPQVELLGGTTAKLMWNFIEMLERRVGERTQELKEVQQELLRNKLTMLQQLSTGVSNELRNPLGVIRNSAHYISDKIKDNPKVTKQLEIIDREIQVAEKIVNDLANIVKPTDLDLANIVKPIDLDTAPADVQQQMIQSERLAEIGIMSAGIAHEVNNPLSVMLGKAEMILEEDDPAHIKKYAQDIIKYSKKASDIVKRITFYSRAASSPGKRVNLNEQLKEAIKISKYSVNFDNVELLTDCQDVPLINGNAGEIEQVFVNLLNNAVEAMQGTGRLSVTSRHENGAVVITIKDTGPGIGKENLNKLFTPFFTTKDPGKGTGLGLNIVHKIIMNHRGSISVESEEGKGTAFIVRFPTALELPDEKNAASK